MTKDQQVQQYMKSLGISKEEAEQLYEDDKADFIGEEGEQMTQKAKTVRRYEQSGEKKVRKPREKKIDPEKVRLIELLNYCLMHPHYIDDELPFSIEGVSVANEQKEIVFNVGENEYSVTLTKHRLKK
jgi:hypothetical protein